jgi:pilus assembly protein FimV
VVFYRSRQRKRATQVDSSFLESRLQPDSFFGASGGQRVDTNESANSSATGSSMVYSPSQLDAAGDVDPVAEADVYLAYGRDLQAEEILKEALRINPSRVAIHGKLLEIYAKRRDAKAFEVLATEAFRLTQGNGPEWDQICAMGKELDADNALYRPGGQPAALDTMPMASAGYSATAGFASSTIPQAIAPAMEESAVPVDLDLDLDFSLGDDLGYAPAATPTPVVAQEPTIKMQVDDPSIPTLDMDFGSGTVALKPMPASAATPSVDPVKLSLPDLAALDNSLTFTPEQATPQPMVSTSSSGAGAVSATSAKPAKPAPALDPGMIEFDLDALSLDLDVPAPAVASAKPAISAGVINLDEVDPLATKLALAEEFYAIGDPDGARSLVEEVVAEASGSLKVKAQRFLAEMA